MRHLTVHPVDERLPLERLWALGLQHVLVMYAGAVAVPLIIGRALQLSPEQVAQLISADLFCSGLVTLIQSLGVTRWFGIRMPVMMGVTFAAVGPMVAMATAHPGPAGAQAIFGTIIGAGFLSMCIAPIVGRLLRFFPPVVTGTLIVVVGSSLMRVAIGWAMGGPATSDRPDYAALDNLALAGFVLAAILVIAKYGRGFFANISVLLGIVAGSAVAAAMGKMSFHTVQQAHWVDVVTPFAFGRPTFALVPILTMTLVMVVVMIESTGMFLALADIVGKPLTRDELTAGLRTDGLGTFLGGIFNTFPYTSFSQNVGLVSVTGVRSRYVCVAAGLIMVGLGLLPKMAALVESVPQFVLGGAGLVMFGTVAATGIRILAKVDFTHNRHNLYIVAVSIGIGMIPLAAPRWTQHMPTPLHPLLESGILLAAVSAIALNLFFNGGRLDQAATLEAAKAADGH